MRITSTKSVLDTAARVSTSADSTVKANVRGVRTRERLLDATIACLIEIGYSRTSMQEVCAKAGISRGAQLHHFPTKARLLSSALDQLARKRGQALTAAVARLPKNQRGIDAVVDLVCDGFSGDLADASMELWIASRTDPELRASLQPVAQALAQDLGDTCREILGPRVDEARFRQFYWLTLNLARGLAIDRILDGSPTRRDALRHDWKHLMAGFLGADSAPAGAKPAARAGPGAAPPGTESRRGSRSG